MNNNMNYFLNNAKMIEFYEELYEKLQEELHGNKSNIEEIKEKLYNSYLNKLDNGYFDEIDIKDFSLFRVFLNGSMLLINKEKMEEEGFKQLANYYENKIFNNPKDLRYTDFSKYIYTLERKYPKLRPINSFYKDVLNSSKNSNLKLKNIRNSFAHMQYGDFKFDSGGAVLFFKAYNYDKTKTAEGIVFEPIFNEFVERIFSNNPNKGIAYNQSVFLNYLFNEKKIVNEMQFYEIKYGKNIIKKIIKKIEKLPEKLTVKEVNATVDFFKKNIKKFGNLKNNEMKEAIKRLQNLSEELTSREVNLIIKFFKKDIENFDNFNLKNSEIEEAIKKLKELAYLLDNRKGKEIIKFLENNKKIFYIEYNSINNLINLQQFKLFL